MVIRLKHLFGGNCGISDNVTDIRFTRTGYYMRKFNNYKSGIGQDADGLMRIYRLAELYLNFAEAAYQAVGRIFLLYQKSVQSLCLPGTLLIRLEYV